MAGSDVAAALQIWPKLSGRAKVATQTQCSISGDRSLFFYNFVDPLCRGKK